MNSVFTELNMADALAKSEEGAKLLNYCEADRAKINLLL